MISPQTPVWEYVVRSAVWEYVARSAVWEHVTRSAVWEYVARLRVYGNKYHYYSLQQQLKFVALSLKLHRIT